jgi:hypothetical protein
MLYQEVQPLTPKERGLPRAAWTPGLREEHEESRDSRKPDRLPNQISGRPGFKRNNHGLTAKS